MSKQQRYTEEFKIEAIRQVTERQHPVAEIAGRLGVSTQSIYAWLKRYSTPPEQKQQDASHQDEIRQLKPELRRVTEERDILKNCPHGLPRPLCIVTLASTLRERGQWPTASWRF